MPTTGLKREAPGSSATPDSATKRFRDCHSSDCSSSSACSSPTSDTADYECCICLGLLVDPVVGQCGHDFCKSCLEEWRDRTSSSGRAGVSCPVCRQQVMAPGVQSLGVCVRLQRLIERQYPEQLQQRRSEIAAAVAERAKAKQREVQEQVASIQDIMRARFSRVAHILGPEQDAPATAAHRPMSSNAASPTAAFSPSYVYGSPTFSAINHQVPMLPLFSGQPQPAVPVFACVQSQQQAAATPSIPQASSWQSPARDAELRQSTIQTLVESFTARRPNMDESFRRRLPSLVRKLEEVLYRTARSQEEYCNAQLLQARVQAVVRQLTERRAERRAQPASPPAPSTSGLMMVQPLLWTPMVAPTVAVGLPVAQFIHHQAVGPVAL